MRSVARLVASGTRLATRTSVRGFVPYPPISRHGVIGDRRTAALVAADGTLDWLCLPDYVDEPVFASLVDVQRGGWWRMGPALPSLGRQQFVDDTPVLVTSWTREGVALELSDAMPWPQERRPDTDEGRRVVVEGRRVVVRRLCCLRSEADCAIDVVPRDMLVPDLRIERDRSGFSIRLLGRRDVRSLGLWSTRELRVEEGGTRVSARFRLREGECAWVVFAVDESPARWSVGAAEEALRASLRSWREWVSRFDVRGSHARAVKRSLVTMHLLG